VSIPRECPICGEPIVSNGQRVWCNGDQCGYGHENTSFEIWWSQQKSVFVWSEMRVVGGAVVFRDAAKQIWDAATDQSHETNQKPD